MKREKPIDWKPKKKKPKHSDAMPNTFEEEFYREFKRYPETKDVEAYIQFKKRPIKFIKGLIKDD